ncbi:branched-chain-amino-acid aminotransferase [Xylaria palmicola]|nr:branched-chain-amino-acid aminotransferase [Xylaria palmicola]
MASFPPPPSDTVDWLTLGTKFCEVNGHVESTYSKSTGRWTPLRFVTDPYKRVHGLAPGLNYGQQVLEGLKAFRGPNDGEINIFRPDANARRMQHSADVVSIPRVPIDMFVQACRSAVARNAEFIPPHASGGTTYVRPLLYGSSPHLMMSPPDDYTFCVFVVPVGGMPSAKPVRAIIVDKFDRSAPHGTGNAKLGGNYAPVLRWSEAMKKEGFGMILHLDSARHDEIDEFSTAGFIGVKDNGPDDVTLVVPDSQCIIESITSISVLRIAESFGWKVDKRVVKSTELGDFDEVMAAGTFLNLVPIRSVTRRTDLWEIPEGPRVSSGPGNRLVTYMSETQDDGGPIYQKLLAQLRAIQRGQAKDEFDWRSTVTEEDLIKCPPRD